MMNSINFSAENMGSTSTEDKVYVVANFIKESTLNGIEVDNGAESPEILP